MIDEAKLMSRLNERQQAALRIVLERQRTALWDAINEYAAACGGDTSSATLGNRRMDAVVAVERAVREMR